jgi:hypothetical protein
MEYFVDEKSVVRKIWGTSDIILFIFAGASAEFALNKAVDWLYHTGRLPADPLGRLFSTVAYAQQIVFSSRQGAHQAIDRMRAIHSSVEASREANIPDWAYRDVLFMLIYYSISSFELLERKLTDPEKEEVFNVFYRVGDRMGIPGLPGSYQEWLPIRAAHLQQNLVYSHYSRDLFKQYRKHLGLLRYNILKEAQKLVIPERVNNLLGVGRYSMLAPVVPVYKLSRKLNLDWLLKAALLPSAYKFQIKQLDKVPT